MNTPDTQIAPPPAFAAMQIATALERLAQDAESIGYRQLAQSITSVMIEASEEARHVNQMTF